MMNKRDLYSKIENHLRMESVIPLCSDLTSLLIDPFNYSLPFPTCHMKKLARFDLDTDPLSAVTFIRIMDSSVNFRTIVKSHLLCHDSDDLHALSDFLLSANQHLFGLSAFVPEKTTGDIEHYSQKFKDPCDSLIQEIDGALDKLQSKTSETESGHNSDQPVPPVKKEPFIDKEVILDSFLKFSAFEKVTESVDSYLRIHLDQVEWLLNTWLSFKSGNQPYPESVPDFQTVGPETAAVVSTIKEQLQKIRPVREIESHPGRLILKINSPVLDTPGSLEIQVHKGLIRFSGLLPYEFLKKTSGIPDLIALNGFDLPESLLDDSSHHFFNICLNQNNEAAVIQEYSILDESEVAASFEQRLLDFLHMYHKLKQMTGHFKDKSKFSELVDSLLEMTASSVVNEAAPEWLLPKQAGNGMN